MPPQPWKTLSTREVYQNKWMRLREDIAEMPNGRTTIYGVCEFGQCVGVLPFVDAITSSWCASIAIRRRRITAGRCPPAACIPAKRRSKRPSAN